MTFCAEHARRNALALRAQMRKQLSSPSPETLLSQLSGYSRPHAAADGPPETTAALGEGLRAGGRGQGLGAGPGSNLRFPEQTRRA